MKTLLKEVLKQQKVVVLEKEGMDWFLDLKDDTIYQVFAEGSYEIVSIEQATSIMKEASSIILVENVMEACHKMTI